ncbi:hypothetical protein [Psychromonas sp. L1A2]|uniref:hypothetical protein n=1 Tax=Psychromonas sp. L1A2 TaxID=2686356 RepID=UPI001357DFDC|nr:hypothetical protein [Psychromonas sp. L1A2]
MSLQRYLQIKILSMLNRLYLSARYLCVEQKLLSILTIIFVNAIMMFSGVIEYITELSTLLIESTLAESSLVNIFSFLADPELSGQLLVGLSWLIFLFFSARRTAIVLQKAAFALSETLQSFIGLNTHGCRAPPQ